MPVINSNDIILLLEKGNFISGQDIAVKLKISRSAVNKKIANLRKKGYVIEGVKNTGYMLLSEPDVINVPKINKNLSEGCIFKSKLKILKQTESTQKFLKNSADNMPEGSLVVAESQTGAYGRFKRSWNSGEGGLWFSFLLKPDIQPFMASSISLVICVEICKTIERMLNIRPSIKWPNDVLVDFKKVAGVLLEMSSDVDGIKWIVAGIGLNVNNRLPSNLKSAASTLKEHKGLSIDRNALLSDFLSGFSRAYIKYLKNGFSSFIRDYKNYFPFMDKNISLKVSGRTYNGTVKNIDSSGRLLLKLDSLKVVKFSAGEMV